VELGLVPEGQVKLEVERWGWKGTFSSRVNCGDVEQCVCRPRVVGRMVCVGKQKKEAWKRKLRESSRKFERTKSSNSQR
jgi:hypothetical protein